MRRFAPAILVAIGAALRLHWNDAIRFSLGDETLYLRTSQQLAGNFLRRFPQFADAYAHDPQYWSTPNPLRWAHWALLSLACDLRPTFESLTLLSTWGGIAALLFTWLLARELFPRNEKAQLASLGFAICSPLQLHLGRRALGDELACAALLAAIWSVSRALDATDWRRHLLAVALCTLALAEKETAILWSPSLLALYLLRAQKRKPRPIDLLLLLPPLLSFLIFCALSHSFSLYFTDGLTNLRDVASQRYLLENAGGPPQMYLIGFFALAPLPFLLGIAGCALAWSDSRARELVAMFILAVLFFAFAPKDVRYLAAGDSLLSLLAAYLLSRAGWPALIALICASGAYELKLFYEVFHQLDVYDPTASNILTALGALPKPK